MKILTPTKLALSITVLSVLSGGQVLKADSAITPPAGQSHADRLIGQVEQTLADSSSISANFQEIDAYPGQYKDLKQAGTVTLAKPNKLDIDVQRFRRISASDAWAPSGNNAKSVSDGSTYSYAFLHPHSTQIQQSAANPGALRSALKGLPPVVGFFRAQAGTELPGQSGPATLLDSANWDGATYQVIQYPVASRDGADSSVIATAYIGSDSLIHRLVYTDSGKGGTSTREWTFDHIVVNGKVADSQFAYTAPKDATTLDRSGQSDLLSPGTPAPDFTAYTKDGKAVKLSDYRGKTVILDFWATWCWPCNQSLPHTEQISKQYKDKGVVVLAVAIRDGEVGFDEWLKRHSYPDIDFVRDRQPQGQDAASTLYGVTTTPTAYVIDPSGKLVQSVAGYSGPSNELASAVSLAVNHSSTVADAR